VHIECLPQSENTSVLGLQKEISLLELDVRCAGNEPWTTILNISSNFSLVQVINCFSVHLAVMCFANTVYTVRIGSGMYKTKSILRSSFGTAGKDTMT